MTRRLLSTGSLAALLALAAACGDAPTISGLEEIDQAEAESLAVDYDLLGSTFMDVAGAPSFSVSGEGAAPAAAVTQTEEWNGTTTCPRGGSTTMAITVTRTFEPATRSGTVQSTAMRTDQACAFRARRGVGTLTLNGNPNVQVTASGSFTSGNPGPRTATQKGAFTWARSTGESGACTVDLTSTYDPATRRRTVKGTFCGHAIDVEHTRSVPAV